MKTILSTPATCLLAAGLVLTAAACGPGTPVPTTANVPPAAQLSELPTPSASAPPPARTASNKEPPPEKKLEPPLIVPAKPDKPPPPPPPPPLAPGAAGKATVTLTVDGNMNASLRPSTDLHKCAREGDDLGVPGLDDFAVDIGKSGRDALLQPLAFAKASPQAFVQSLARPGASIACSEGTFPVDLKIPKPKLRSTTPVIAPDYEWTDFDTLYGPGLRQALGDPTACKYLPDGQNEAKSGGAACSLVPFSPEGNPSGTHYRLQITGSPTTGAVELVFPAQSKPTLDLPIATCAFNPVGRLQVIVPGARRQTLALSGSLPACEARLLSQRGPAAISLVNGDKTISGSATGAGSVVLDLHDVRADLQEGSGAWEVHDAGGALIGKVNLRTVKPISVDPTLDVAYADDALDKAQSGKSAARTAVVDPIDESSVDESALFRPPSPRPANVTNTATVTVAADLGAASVASNAFQSERGGLAWTASRHTLRAAGVTLLGVTQTGVPVLGDEQLLPSLRRLPFRVTKRSTSGVTIPLKLWYAQKDERYDVPLLEVDLKVADVARPESVPFPIARYLQIVCDGQTWPEHVAGNGSLVSIAEGALPNGECKAHLDYGLIHDHIGPDHAYLLTLYGPQTVTVTVKRGAATASATWTLNLSPAKVVLDASTCKKQRIDAAQNDEPMDTVTCQRKYDLADELPLPAPTPDKGTTSDPYVVDVAVLAADGGQVPYRDPPAAGAGADAPRQPLTHYHAQLRSRGTFGVSCPHRRCARAFVSIPVDLVGVRFGASAIDLKSSTSPKQFQVLGPRVGLLAGVELWDYERSKPYLLLAPRLVTGLYAFQFTQPNVALSWMKGLQFAYPILEHPATAQLDTSISIGLYWETDLRDDWHSAAAQHFVVTSSVNVLNLFGAK